MKAFLGVCASRFSKLVKELSLFWVEDRWKPLFEELVAPCWVLIRRGGRDGKRKKTRLLFKKSNWFDDLINTSPIFSNQVFKLWKTSWKHNMTFLLHSISHFFFHFPTFHKNHSYFSLFFEEIGRWSTLNFINDIILE